MKNQFSKEFLNSLDEKSPEYNLFQQYLRDCIDDSTDPFEYGSLSYLASDIIENLDPIAWRQIQLDTADQLLREIKEE
ncbi:MAG: hypothetical protein ACYCOU_16240 [Sulfobacillus sp.]